MQCPNFGPEKEKNVPGVKTYVCAHVQPQYLSFAIPQNPIREGFTKKSQSWDIIPISGPPLPEDGTPLCDFLLLFFTLHIMKWILTKEKKMRKKSLYKMV